MCVCVCVCSGLRRAIQAKNTSIKLPCCIKLQFQIISVALFAKILYAVRGGADLSQLLCYDLPVAHYVKLNIYTDSCETQFIQI